MKKMNMGATDFLKQQKKELLEAKLNKNIPKSLFGGQKPDLKLIKNKGKAPVEADMVHDAESLQDMLRDLMVEYKTVMDDTKQVSKNVFEGENAFRKAKHTLNGVLN